MEHCEIAMDLFDQGFNCAQAGTAAFCEEYGLDTDTALRLSSSFGGGVGRLREVCGAVSGMALILGLSNPQANANDSAVKLAYYEQTAALCRRFEAENGSMICRELLAANEIGPEQFRNPKLCRTLVGRAAALLEMVLNGTGIDDREQNVSL